ncbi:E3 ubiquitin-protein ligase NEDD4-like [Dreissena polymorpha]|nr:E3 ubiquitin-protein ligase NEDD4-like [Dreissena polymorpha]
MGHTESKDEIATETKQEVKEEESLNGVLRELRALQTQPTNHLIADRSCVLENAFSYFKSGKSELSPLEVSMVTSGYSEHAKEQGGPMREFFSLFFKEVLRKDIDMFEGQDHGQQLFPVNNARAIENHWFHALGKAIVVSTMSGGPGFPYLAPIVVQYLRGLECEHDLNISMVQNMLLRQLIKRINNAADGDQLQDAVDSDVERYIDNCGWPRPNMITISNRLELTQYLLKWEILSKRFAALEQLKHGLNTLQFLDKTRDLHEVENILQAENGDHATAEYLKESLTKEIGRLNPRSERETNAKDFTLKCLDMLTDSEAVSLFHFITGMSSLPVNGIPLEVEFNRVDPSSELPQAITCIQRLRIPLGNETAIAFYSSFHKALTHGQYGSGRSERS